MQEFWDKVAVVTGGASGIGRALAAALCQQGMRVVIADVEEPALSQVVDDFRQAGASVIGMRTDVSRASDVEALRDRALSAFGAVHLVCNNAGIGTAGGVADTPLERWRWALDVNLWGVIHGCHVFVPLLKAQREGHLVNTASIAGLHGHAMLGAYTASKSGVVGLSECLHHELVAAKSPVRVSVFCPGPVQTNIRRSERNRPGYVPEFPPGPLMTAARHPDPGMLSCGMPAAQAAQAVLDGIRAERFYIFTHPEIARQEAEARMAWMLEGMSPA